MPPLNRPWLAHQLGMVRKEKVDPKTLYYFWPTEVVPDETGKPAIGGKLLPMIHFGDLVKRKG